MLNYLLLELQNSKLFRFIWKLGKFRNFLCILEYWDRPVSHRHRLWKESPKWTGNIYIFSFQWQLRIWTHFSKSNFYWSSSRWCTMCCGQNKIVRYNWSSAIKTSIVSIKAKCRLRRKKKTSLKKFQFTWTFGISIILPSMEIHLSPLQCHLEFSKQCQYLGLALNTIRMLTRYYWWMKRMNEM